MYAAAAGLTKAVAGGIVESSRLNKAAFSLSLSLISCRFSVLQVKKKN